MDYELKLLNYSKRLRDLLGVFAGPELVSRSSLTKQHKYFEKISFQYQEYKLQCKYEYFAL